MARTIYGDHQRFLATYFQSYPGELRVELGDTGEEKREEGEGG